ncbi:EamA family transporter [Amycolatopsis suaedae]|uniref:EamA family transporter n=1 Tax=Amycolatopsis suaedae TaxID=2510978 RepID=A0A4Q7J2E2_9PSEU|nr:EamA family transporter [Amycolatopsis suaedae]
MAGLWLCWGSSFPAMRVMVETLPPLLAAGLTLAAVRRPALDRRTVLASARTGCCLLGAQGAVAVAQRNVPASTAAILVAAVPLWITLLRAVTGDRPTRAAILRTLTGFAGVVVVLVGSHSGGGWTPWALLVIAASVLWAAGTVQAARTRPATALQLATGGALLLALGLLVGERVDPASVSTASWLAAAHLVLVDSLAGFLLYNRLLATQPVSLVSTYAYAVPVVAYLIGVLVLGEPFHPLVLAGAAVVVAGVAAEVRA